MHDNKEEDTGEIYKNNSNLILSTVISHIINEMVPVILTISASSNLNSSTNNQSH